MMGVWGVDSKSFRTSMRPLPMEQDSAQAVIVFERYIGYTFIQCSQLQDIPTIRIIRTACILLQKSSADYRLVQYNAKLALFLFLWFFLDCILPSWLLRCMSALQLMDSSFADMHLKMCEMRNGGYRGSLPPFSVTQVSICIATWLQVISFIFMTAGFSVLFTPSHHEEMSYTMNAYGGTHVHTITVQTNPKDLQSLDLWKFLLGITIVLLLEFIGNSANLLGILFSSNVKSEILHCYLWSMLLIPWMSVICIINILQLIVFYIMFFIAEYCAIIICQVCLGVMLGG